MSIVLLGDLVIDRYYFGKTNRIAPEGPFPVININSISNKLGCIGNVLNNLEDFFDKIYLITNYDSSELETLKLFFKDKKNVLIKNFEIKNKKIIFKNRILSDNNYVARFDQENIIYTTDECTDKIINYLESIKNEIDIILYSDYAKGFLSDKLLKKSIEFANKNNIFTLLDPKGNDYSKYKNIDLIKPNFKELCDFYKKNINSKEDILNASNIILNDLNIKNILLTKGENGMSFIEKDNTENINIIDKPIIPSSVIDVIGCGDCILSSVCIYYIKNKNIDNRENLLNFLTKIGSKAVTFSGCFVLNKKNLANIISSNEYYNKKKVVFTNGCFDILHPGHIKYLKEAAKLGDKLIIGINSDSSIKKIKGDNRPINKLHDRILMLKELNLADEIIPFDEESPIEIIKKIKPNILVKGGDYRLDDVIGREYCDETILLSFDPNYSSTKIINKVIKNYKLR